MDDTKRPTFGNRFLKDDAQVFLHNAWDNVEWTEEQESNARQITTAQAENSMPDEEQEKFLSEAPKFWDKFYEKHENKFFKDRHWLFTEFPELLLVKESKDNEELLCNDDTNDGELLSNNETTVGSFPGSDSKVKFMEIGCGVGNTIFPILKVNNENLFMYGCDYSQTAVDIVKNHKEFNPKSAFVFVHDISTEDEFPIPNESLDVVIMIFVLSALQFRKMGGAVKRIAKLLKPGGVILFRDYGRYDMAQLRFKHRRCISDNFYTRGDGTMVYFFTQGEVKEIFTSAGLMEEQNLVDRRLQVNRARQIKMYRVWVQAKYRK
uniref:tRNA N(3)-methylcytidine methyltransferase n=1 Tax=Ciona intestinalis TaxID=7719 RepID=F6YCY6_CIOIN